MKFDPVTREEAEAYAAKNKAPDGRPLHVMEAADMLMTKRVRKSVKAIRLHAQQGNIAKAIEGLCDLGISMLDAREQERHGRG